VQVIESKSEKTAVKSVPRAFGTRHIKNAGSAITDTHQQ